jgi:WD40 repeat protein
MKAEQELPVPEPARGHDVFVSYSRADRQAIVGLTSALAERGKRAWVDLEDIPPSAEWMAEIRTAIEGADAYLVAISPDLARSKVCQQELELARSAGKRIVPVQVRPTEPELVPDALSALNWIDATQGATEGAVDRIVQALDTDLEHVRAHSWLLVRASEWGTRGESRSLLLRGEDLKDAEILLVATQGKEPAPTPGQARFVHVSRQGASRRQRSAVAIALCVALVAASLGVLAWQQRNTAVEQRDLALSRELAAASTTQLDVDPELSLLLAIHAATAAPTREAAGALRAALTASNHTATLRGDTNPIVDASFSPDGTRVLTTSGYAKELIARGDSGEYAARIWDVATGRLISAIEGAGPGLHAQWLPDGQTILTSGDGAARIWDASTGEQLRTLGSISSGVAHADPSGRSVVGRCEDGSVCIVDATSGDVVMSLGAVGGDFRDARFTPDGRFVAAFGDRGLAVWNARTGEAVTLEGLDPGTVVGRFLCPGCHLDSLSISADSSRLLVAGGSDAVLWNLPDGRLVRLWPTYADTTRYRLPFAPAIAPDGSKVASMNTDGTVSMWRVASDQAPTILDESAVTDVEFSPDGSRLLTTSEDHTGIVWDADNGDELGRFLGSPGRLFLGRFSPDGSRVVTAGSDLAADLWVVDRGAPLAVFSARGGSGYSVAFSPDGSKLVTTGRTGNVDLWDAREGSLMREFSAPSLRTDDVWGSTFSPDGSLVAASSTFRSVQLWDVATGEPTMTLRFAKGEGPGSPGAPADLEGVVWAVVFSKDGSTIGTASQDGIARLWDAKTGDLILRYEGHEAAVNYLAFSPGGDRVLTGSDDGTAQVWSASDGKTLMTLHGHPEGVQAVGWSPDGKVLATGGYDGVIRLWDASSGRLLHTLTGSQGQIMRVDFSPDSRWIASSSDEDGALRIWEVGTGRLVDVHQGDLGSMGFRIDFAPDGSEVAVAGSTAPFGKGTGETLLYRCEVCVGIDALISLAESRVTRALTQAERAQFLHE